MSTKADAKLRELIRKIALLNAVQHDGKAQTGPVIGKLLGEQPSLKAEVKKVSGIISQIVDEVNHLSLEEQKRIVEERWPSALVKVHVEEEKRLPPLPKADKYPRVVTRFSPNPDCVLH